MKRPICTNCKWIASNPDSSVSKCLAPYKRDIGEELAGNPKAKIINEYCSIERSTNWLAARLTNSCGQEGRWFEPKASS